MKLENINVVGKDKDEILDHVFACHEEIRKLRKGLEAVEMLIDESECVTGLHQNGDWANWESLRTGGRFEEWLIDFDRALK